MASGAPGAIFRSRILNAVAKPSRMVIEPPAAELADTHCWNEAAGLVLTFRPDSISPMVCCWLLIGMDAGSLTEAAAISDTGGPLDVGTNMAFTSARTFVIRNIRVPPCVPGGATGTPLNTIEFALAN